MEPAAPDSTAVPPSSDASTAAGPPGRWQGLPLYVRILIGLVLGVLVGTAFGPLAGRLHLDGPVGRKFLDAVAVPATLVLRLLNALATPLIFLAVVRALLTADIQRNEARRLSWLLFSNTLVAILIGLIVADTVRPGLHSAKAGDAPAATAPAEGQSELGTKNPLDKLLENVPGSLLKPIVDGNPVAAIVVALGVGFAFRRLGGDARAGAAIVTVMLFDAIVVMLHWVIQLVPLAIFCKVTNLVGVEGFSKFAKLGWFVAAVLIALALQALFYFTRLRINSWVRPTLLVRGTRDALVMAFSTASSTATTPVTYSSLIDKVGLRKKSADLGAMIGSNFNNDGTALYEAMCALFVAQLLGTNLSLVNQVLVVLTSIVASVGAAGIPEAGLVTMTLVFNAVGLPLGMIPLLLTVDWFLDRCRTTVNVLADMTVSCILDGKTREEAAATASA